MPDAMPSAIKGDTWDNDEIHRIKGNLASAFHPRLLDMIRADPEIIPLS
jgi:hypothetical protein